MRNYSWIFKGLIMTFLAVSFTAFASLWEVPFSVSQGVSDPGTPPIIVADHEDNAAMVWGQSGEVYSSYRPFGGTWETPTIHGKGFGYDICMDEAGNVTLVFVTSTGTWCINAAFRPYGSTWTTTAETIATATAPSPAFVSDLSLTCTSTNFYGYLSWYDSNDVRVKTLYRRGAGSGTGSSGWDTTTGPRDVNTATNTANPQSDAIIKVHSNGNATIVGKFTTPLEDFYFSTLTTPGGAWPALTTLGFQPTIANAETFDFDMQPNGNGVVAGLGGNTLGITSTSTPGTWPATPYNTGISSVATPSCGVDSNGLATVLWVVGGATVQVAHDNVGGTTWTPMTLARGGSFSRGLVDVSRNGYRIVAWNDGGANPSKIVALRGQHSTLEDTSSFVDAEISQNSLSVCASTTSRGFGAWNDIVTTGFAEASKTYEPVDAKTNLLRALGKKRLIYQQARYP